MKNVKDRNKERQQTSCAGIMKRFFIRYWWLLLLVAVVSFYLGYAVGSPCCG